MPQPVTVILKLLEGQLCDTIRQIKLYSVTSLKNNLERYLENMGGFTLLLSM